MRDYLGMTQLESFIAFSFFAKYYAAPDLTRAAGVFSGWIEGPNDIDVANTIPALEQFFDFAEEHRALEITLDFSRVTAVHETCVPTIAARCSRLRSLGTRLCFLEPVKCQMSSETADGMQEIYRTGALLFGEAARKREEESRIGRLVLDRMGASVIFCIAAMKIVSAYTNFPVPGLRFAVGVAIAAIAAKLSRLFPVVAANKDPQSIIKAQKDNAKLAGAVFFAGLLVALYFIK